ncbi:zf-HC2 domain-containing protein [Streptomyces fractus]|uniref:zf-HC2 domain-containing protein n=1 Tax=Streptomyces fractus TaxID=641806 RepID=UPI003CF0E26E
MSAANGPDRFDPYGEDPEGTGGREQRGGGEEFGGGRPAGDAAGQGPTDRPWIPTPRSSVEDTGRPLPDAPAAEPPVLEHRVLKSLLGAWALAACSPEEAAAVEVHLGGCGACAEEALRLRDAVGLLHAEESLDLDPMLRSRVLEGCLTRRPARIPVPGWASPYDAETARLDALLQDIGDGEWHAPVRLRWYEGAEQVGKKTTVAGVIAHLTSVDGLVARALGLEDSSAVSPLRPGAGDLDPTARTKAYWKASYFPPTRAVRAPWREQSHSVIRTVSFAGSDEGRAGGSGQLPVSYGNFELALRDAMIDRAFECWIHAGDIADAIDYPYEAPAPRHLNRMIDLAARLLPGSLATRRRHGLAAPARELVGAGRPGRSLRLEVEGAGGGEWLIALDSPAAVGSDEREVAHVALDGVEFCRLAAGHVLPEEAAAGQVGDREAIQDVLSATAGLSRL